MTTTPGRSARPGRPPAPTRSSENERPTVNPPFDVEAFARQASGPRPSRRSRRTRRPRDRHPRRPSPRSTPARRGRAEQITAHERGRSSSRRASRRRRAASRPPPSIRARSRSPTRAPRARPTVDRAWARAAACRRRASRPPSSGAIGASPAPEITERTIEDPVAEMRERFSLGRLHGRARDGRADPRRGPGRPRGGRVRRELPQRAREACTRRGSARSIGCRWSWCRARRCAGCRSTTAPGFILSLIDGSSSVEMILDVCGMPKLDALRILHELVQQKIVALPLTRACTPDARRRP